MLTRLQPLSASQLCRLGMPSEQRWRMPCAKPALPSPSRCFAIALPPAVARVRRVHVLLEDQADEAVLDGVPLPQRGKLVVSVLGRQLHYSDALARMEKMEDKVEGETGRGREEWNV